MFAGHAAYPFANMGSGADAGDSKTGFKSVILLWIPAKRVSNPLYFYAALR